MNKSQSLNQSILDKNIRLNLWQWYINIL